MDLHKEILVSCLLLFRLFSLGVMLSEVQGKTNPLILFGALEQNCVSSAGPDWLWFVLSA